MHQMKNLRFLVLSPVILTIMLTTSCAPLLGAVEASFTLAPDSRLPTWLKLPSDVERNGVKVTLNYLTPAVDRDDTVLDVRDKSGRTLTSLSGSSCWHPIMQSKKNKFGGFDADSYPHYRYMKIGGVIEVFEHVRMEPVFRISDDGSLKRSAAAATACDKG